MEGICRLCLTLSSPLSFQDLSSALTRKIEAVLPIQVIDNNFLPKSVCSSCIEKVDEIHDYHLKVAANQNLLLRYLNEGVHNLNEFYFTLKNNLVKLEKEGEKILGPKTLEVVIKQEKDDKSNEEQLLYTNRPIEIETGIKKETVDNDDDDDDDDDIYSDENNPLWSDKETKVPAKRKREKVSAKGKKENVSTKRKKENAPAEIKKEDEAEDQLKPPDGGKLSHEIKIEIENFIDEGDDQTDQEDENNQNDRYKCLTCFIVFENKDDLLFHYRNDHKPTSLENEPESTQCKYTEEKYNDGYRFKCEKCEYTNKVRWHIERHVKSHTDKRPFNCKICGRVYKTALEIYTHGRAHTTAKLECMYHCGFATAYKGALKNHEAVHRAEYKYTCTECGTGFHTNIQLIEHRNKHQGVRPFVCDVCGAAFHVRRYLQTHKSKLHPQSSSLKRYLCVHCSLPCDTMNALNEHMKAEHEKRTEFLCDLCGKTFKNKDKLTCHKRTHLGIKPFECHICGKKMAKKFNLNIHINGHTKEQYFQCQCGKKYIQKSALVRHQNTRCPDISRAEASKYSTEVDESQEATTEVDESQEVSTEVDESQEVSTEVDESQEVSTEVDESEEAKSTMEAKEELSE